MSKSSAYEGKRSKGRFAADVLKLTSGTVLAQVVSLLAAPLITRLFSPQAFGIVALFTSIVGILAIVVCLRYDRSIIVPAGDQEAMNLVGVSLSFVLLTTVLSGVVVFSGKRLLLSRLNAPGLGPQLWLVPIYVFFFGLLAALCSWNTRKRHFTLITISSMLSSVGYVCFAIVAGSAGHNSGGALIVGTVFGLGISVLPLVVEAWREGWPDLIKHVNLEHMREALRKYHRFPKYGTAAAILNSLSWELPAFFLSGFFSTAVVGQYALGQRLIRIPMSFIGLNVSRVFSQRAAGARHEGDLAPLVEKTFQLLVKLGMFPFLMLSLFGKELFGLVFGARWEEAGVYTEILSLWAFFWFASTPLTSVLDILDEQAFDLRMNVLILASRFLSLSLGCYLGSPRMALAIFSASGVLVYGYYCLAILTKCGVPFSHPLRVLTLEFGRFLPFGALVLAAKFLRAPSLLVVSLSTVLLLIYYLSAIRSDPDLRDMVGGMMRKKLSRELVSEVSA
jgi:lipopolysaccharide exporter